jgi:hypothetical protein
MQVRVEKKNPAFNRWIYLIFLFWLCLGLQFNCPKNDQRKVAWLRCEG